MSKFSIDQHTEASAISLSNSFENMYIVLIYRAPSGNFTIFLKKIRVYSHLFFRNNIKIIRCGCLSNNNKKKKMDLFNLVSTVDFPMRLQNNSATAIDNIFIDVSLQRNYVIYSLCNGLSDHDAQLIS
jgi:hypothetical protein